MPKSHRRTADQPQVRWLAWLLLGIAALFMAGCAGLPSQVQRKPSTAIGTIERTVVTARSSLYRSAPIKSSGPDYINAVVAVRTGLTAEAFLSELQLLEDQAGRERPFPNAPRTLDLDLLTHGNTVKDTPALSLPHPRMRERAFVLKPLAEIAPDKVPRAALARVSGQVIERIRS